MPAQAINYDTNSLFKAKQIIKSGVTVALVSDLWWNSAHSENKDTRVIALKWEGSPEGPVWILFSKRTTDKGAVSENLLCLYNQLCWWLLYKTVNI